MRIARTFTMPLLFLTAAACQPATDATAPPPPSVARAEAEPEQSMPRPPTTRPAAKPTSVSGSASSTVTHWQCDGVQLDLREEGAIARIDFSGRSLTLQHGESLIGARYSDQQGNAFMRDGDHATLTLAGSESHDCASTDNVP